MNAIPVELTLLGVSVVIGLVQLVWATVAAAGQREKAWLIGPRDEAVAPLTGVAGRLTRAHVNFMETFPLFAAALLAAVAAGKLGHLTLWGAAVYAIGRALYAPLYAAGTPMLRSLVWSSSPVAIVLILVALFG